ncbi:hypothetical protein PybrP1_000707 [[Pythium] brassicae (nom. inval.)]|nr:hypothetical protein PybrP1_000707 [[Pythium] brassicae (nom. inval.)]
MCAWVCLRRAATGYLRRAYAQGAGVLWGRRAASERPASHSVSGRLREHAAHEDRPRHVSRVAQQQHLPRVAVRAQ